MLSRLFVPCSSKSSQHDFSEKAQPQPPLVEGTKIASAVAEPPVTATEPHTQPSPSEFRIERPSTSRQDSETCSPNSAGRNRGYSRSSVISQVRITVETATESVASPLSSPNIRGTGVSEGSEGVVALDKHASAASSKKRDSGYQDHSVRTDTEMRHKELPELLESLQSPKQQLFRPLSLTGLPRLHSSPPELAHNLLQVRPLYPRRAHSSSDASVRSTTSTLSVHSGMPTRKRLVSHVSSGSTGLDLRLAGRMGGGGHAAEMSNVVELVKQNKLERMPFRQDESAIVEQEVD